MNKIVPDGRELTMRLCSQNEIVGESILFSNAPKHTTNAKMIESGEVVAIGKKEFEKQMTNNSQLAVEFLTWLTITIHNIPYLKNEIDCINCPIDICNME